MIDSNDAALACKVTAAMSLDDALPNCDFDDCWSRANPDRAYGDEGIPCTANGNDNVMERHWTAMGGDSDAFWACEVCAANAGFPQWTPCDGCGVHMVAHGMRLVERQFCRNCMPEDTIHSVAAARGLCLEGVWLEDWVNLAYASQGDRGTVEDEREFDRAVEALEVIDEDLERAYDTAAFAKVGAEEEGRRRRVHHILRLFPTLTPEQARELDDGWSVDGDTTAWAFLSHLKRQ